MTMKMASATAIMMVLTFLSKGEWMWSIYARSNAAEPFTFDHCLLCNSKPLITLLRGAAVQGYTTFNDDIQATAAVTLGSLYGAQRQEGVPKLADQTFLFFGAGQANIGAAQLLTLALAQQGLSAADARSRIWLMDSQVRPRPDFQQYPACLLPLVKGGICWSHLVPVKDRYTS